MSIEGNNTVRKNTYQEIATNKETNIRSADLASFTVNEYFRPYLSEEPDNPFISPTIAKELKRFIPQLIVDVLVSNHEALEKDRQLTIGGSSMEVFSGLISAESYWTTKHHFIKALTTKPEINQDLKDFIKNPLQTLAYGDPDLDLYVENNESLDVIFDKFHDNYPLAEIETNESDERQFQVQVPNSNINLFAYSGPIQKDSSGKRLYFRLKDSKDKPLFHIDITSKGVAEGKVFDRRKIVGSIHDQCRGEIDTQTGNVNIDLNTIPKAFEPSQMRLEEKDINVIPEIVIREMRKKLSHVTFNKEVRENISIYQLFPLMKADDIFFLRELTSNPEYNIEKIIQNQSEHQKDTLYRELFLMSQIDPYLTALFLQDTGFDTIFFGRHLTRREGLKILASSWLDFDANDIEQNDNISIQDVNKSRLKLLNLEPDHPYRNGFVRFVSAIGQAFGTNPKNFKEHFNDGLDVLQNPKLLPEPNMPTNIPSDETLHEMYETITNWGGLTETALHTILNKKNPKKYPIETGDDKKNFRIDFIRLKISGLLEVARREVLIDKKSSLAYFYYPSTDNRSTYELLPWFDNKQKKPDPEHSEYWEILIKQGSLDRFIQASSIMPSELAHAWVNLVIMEITSLEALFGIKEDDWIIIEEQHKNILKFAGYDKINLIREFLASRQTEVLKEEKMRSWIYPDWDT